MTLGRCPFSIFCSRGTPPRHRGGRSARVRFKPGFKVRFKLGCQEGSDGNCGDNGVILSQLLPFSQERSERGGPQPLISKPDQPGLLSAAFLGRLAGFLAYTRQRWSENGPASPNWRGQLECEEATRLPGRAQRVDVPGVTDTLHQRIGRETNAIHARFLEGVATSQSPLKAHCFKCQSASPNPNTPSNTLAWLDLAEEGSHLRPIDLCITQL